MKDGGTKSNTKAEKEITVKTKTAKVEDTKKTTVPTKATQANTTTQKKVAGQDKSFGKDAKGRTIYEGPRGGKYYINSNGNKTYIQE